MPVPSTTAPASIDGHPADRQEDPAPERQLGDQPEDPRGAGAGRNIGDDVADPADLVAVGVEDGEAGEPRDVDPRADRHQARLPTPAGPGADHADACDHGRVRIDAWIVMVAKTSS